MTWLLVALAVVAFYAVVTVGLYRIKRRQNEELAELLNQIMKESA